MKDVLLWTLRPHWKAGLPRLSLRPLSPGAAEALGSRVPFKAGALPPPRGLVLCTRVVEAQQGCSTQKRQLHVDSMWRPEGGGREENRQRQK